MKATTTIPLFIGLCLGVGVTYLLMREMGSSSKVIQTEVAHEAPRTDDGEATDSEETPDVAAGEDGYGLILSDPNSVQQRHLCIAAWYGDQNFVSSSFGTHTGHKFSPVWNRRNPIMILEEHLEFMKEFMAETDRLEMEQFPQYRDTIERRHRREDATDPQDGALIDWQDYFDGGKDDKSRLWYGMSMKAKRWLAYTGEKGVYEPDDALLKRIIEKEKYDSEAGR